MNKNELISVLRRACDRIAIDNETNEMVAQFCYKKFKLPLSRTKDIISDRIEIKDLSNDELYFLACGVEICNETFHTNNYFNEDELKIYRKKQYTGEQITWPFTIDCIEVESKQWIGSIDAQTLLKLDKAGKIQYNANKQRTLTKIIDGNRVIFKPTIVMKSVKQIAALMEDGEYIPDDITLDIPEDSIAEYKYDPKYKELVIDSIDHFDITDGYHRFKAIQECADKDPKFNYQMEIRITAFSAQRSRQFIYQKDQKNKMSRSDSKSMDAFRYSNEIVTRLNERGNGCVLSGMITRNENSSVDFAALSDLIEHYWIKINKGKKYSNKELIEITQEVKEILNRFVTEDPDYFDRKFMSFRILAVLFWLVKGKGKTPEEAVKILKKWEDNGKLEQIRLRNIRKSLFDQLESLL